METLDELTVAEIEKLGSGAAQTLGEGLGGYLERVTNGGRDFADTVNETLAVINQLEEKVGFEDDFRADAIASLAEAAPFEIWDAWRATANKDEGTEVLRVIASAMASVDPGRAMDTVLRDTAGEGTSDIYRSWEAKAPAEASEWFAKNSKLIPQKERDWMLAHDSREALKDGKFQAAREAAWAMSDPKAKSDLEGAVWTKERELVRKEIAANPAATMDAIASGESAFTANWMEEGMTRWVDKDLPAAQSWYEKNWKNLKPDKAQFIAAAFAKQAARQGDPAAARQWASHILEAKTKARILAEIDKSPPPPTN